jgi:hypothetical protein
MTGAAVVLAALKRQGIQARATERGTVALSPAERVTEETRALVTENKLALLAFFRGRPANEVEASQTSEPAQPVAEDGECPGPWDTSGTWPERKVAPYQWELIHPLYGRVLVTVGRRLWN